MIAIFRKMERSYSSTSKFLTEASPDICFFSEGLNHRVRQIRRLREWLHLVAVKEGCDLGALSIVLCSDEYLLKVNMDHLDHDYYTDIITFDYHTTPISGDLFISIDRVKENAKQLKLKTVDELHRVMVHGLLHLLGYKDNTDEDRQKMRALEDTYLALRNFV